MLERVLGEKIVWELPKRREETYILLYLPAGVASFTPNSGGTRPQSNDLSSGPIELVQHFRLKGKFTSSQERCLTLI